MYYPRSYLNEVLRKEFKEAGMKVGTIGWSDTQQTISVLVEGKPQEVSIPYTELEPTPSLLRSHAIGAIRGLLQRH